MDDFLTASLRSGRIKTLYITLSLFSCNVLFKELASLLNMRELILSNNNLRTVEPSILGSALARLNKLSLPSASLNSRQVVSIMHALLASADTVTDLIIVDNNLSGVDSALLGRALEWMVTVNLQHTRLTNEQVVRVVEAITKSSTLVDVDVGWNFLCDIEAMLLGWNDNMREIEARILGDAARRLTSLHLPGTRLTKQQLNSILIVAQTSTTLKQLNIRENMSIDRDIILSLLSKMGDGLEVVF